MILLFHTFLYYSLLTLKKVAKCLAGNVNLTNLLKIASTYSFFTFKNKYHGVTITVGKSQSGVFTVNFEHISYLVLVFLLLTLRR